MKNGKRPTVAQKKLLKAMGLIPENWLIVKNEPDRMTVVHRHSGERRTFPRP